GAALLPRGAADRSLARGAVGRADPREGPLAHARRASACDLRRARGDRGEGRARLDPRRDRVAEADRGGQGRRAREGDRDARPPGDRSAARPPGLPRTQGQGAAEVAPRRRDARATWALAADGDGGGDRDRLDRLAEALQLEPAERLSVHELLHLREHPLADDDL